MWLFISFACMDRVLSIERFLVAKFSSSLLYGFGIVLSTIVMATMMFVNSIGIVELGITGLILGFLQVFLTNRYFLALNATNDANRNYFFGLETFFSM